MSSIIFTLAEDPQSTTDVHFAVKYSVDENDCFDFAHGLSNLGHQIFFANWRDLNDDRFERIFDYNRKCFVKPIYCSQFDLAFVYKMEGFLFDMPAFFRMVSQFERSCPTVINHPRTIRHNIDKSYLWELERAGIRIIPTFTVDDTLKNKLSPDFKLVLKPRCGERGNGIFLAERPEDLDPIKGRENQYIAQQYMPEIRDGERSLVFLGHDYQHAVLKRPSAKNTKEFRCNESLGGTVDIYQPTQRELEFSCHLLNAYERKLGCPVHFSRVDLISVDGSPVLVEAELLNPSIYANYSNKGPQFGSAIAHYFDNLLRAQVAAR